VYTYLVYIWMTVLRVRHSFRCPMFEDRRLLGRGQEDEERLEDECQRCRDGSI
jgi:hypothetical protein